MIKPIFTYSNNKQIWRLLLTEKNRLIIEERDLNNKEVFFNCVEVESGKKIFSNFQFEEKYWAGIEAIHNEIIFFHKFINRDMPDHMGIFAFDINTKKILWKNDDLIFLFILQGKVFCYKNKFDSREFFSLDFKTGNLVEELGEDSKTINLFREQSYNSNNYNGYFFPTSFNSLNNDLTPYNKLLNELKENYTIAGSIDYIEIDNLLFFNFHEVQSDGTLTNRFKAIEYLTKNVILEEVLNTKTKSFIPDSFFIKDNFVFLLIEKTKLKVYSIKNN